MEEAGAGSGLQFPAGALGDLLAVVDDGDARGELIGLFEILRGQQDGDAGIGKAADHAPDILAGVRIEPSGWLVEEEHTRSDDQRGGDIEPPSHAARIVLHLLRRRFGQTESREQVVGTGLRGATAKAPESGEQDKVLPARQIFVERSELSGHGYCRANLMRGLHEIMPHDGGGAGVGAREGREHPHQRGLAGAIWTEDGENHAARHIQIYSVDRAHIAKRLDEAPSRNGQWRNLGGKGQVPCGGSIVHGDQSGSRKSWDSTRLACASRRIYQLCNRRASSGDVSPDNSRHLQFGREGRTAPPCQRAERRGSRLQFV